MAPATGGGRREMKVTGRELRYKRVRGALAGRIKRQGGHAKRRAR